TAVRVAGKDGTAGVEAWRRRLAAVEASIAAGEHATALPAAVALQGEMQSSFEGGGSDLLAEASMLRALAAAALAEEAESAEGRAAAVWHWQAAQNLAPQLRYRDLGRWGEAGAVLAAHFLSPATLGEPASTRDVAPRVVERSHPRAGAAGSGLVEIEVAIDAEGRPRRPVWNAGDSPARVSAALEALRGWRFEAESGERRRRVVVQVTDTADSLRLTNGEIALIGLAARWMGKDPVIAACLWSSAQSLEPRLSVIDPAILAGPEEIQGFLLDHLLAPATYRGWSPFPSSDVHQVGGEVEPPVKVSAPQPQYTAEARAERVEGQVFVQSLIDADGRIQKTRVLRGLPHGLSEVSVATICQWRFKPARLHGEKIGVYYNLTVNFTLR
ncbi:MAG TPA: energy transducer TonB, partial [Thermoanaerobaculia bacterium]|nr:energy transducer TonB [Thermoanaerobaculia bacterium]